jgi:hypothetical protein
VVSQAFGGSGEVRCRADNCQTAVYAFGVPFTTSSFIRFTSAVNSPSTSTAFVNGKLSAEKSF